MGFIDLPLELLREVLVHAVNVRGIQRGLRLRLVNRLFSKEVQIAIFDSDFLTTSSRLCGEPCENEDKPDIHHLFGSPPLALFTRHWLRKNTPDSQYYQVFRQSYVTYKVMQCNALEGPGAVIRHTAERLCEQTGDNSSETMRKYVHELSYPPTLKVLSFFAVRNEMFPRYLLQAAIIVGHPAIVQRILGSSNNPMGLLRGVKSDDVWKSPSVLAGHFGNREILQILFSKSQFDPDDGIRHGALRGALMMGNLEAVAFILDWGPMELDHNSSRTKRLSSHGVSNSPLPDFAPRLVTLFASRSTPHCPIVFQEPTSNELLDIVVEIGTQGQIPVPLNGQRVDVAEYLLDHGAIVQRMAPIRGSLSASETFPSDGAARDARRPWNPLNKAIKSGQEGVVRLLLERGADATKTDDDSLWTAVKRGRFDIVRLLVENGFDVNREPCESDDTPIPKRPPKVPIVQALGVEHEQMSRYLHEHGAELKGIGSEYMPQLAEVLRQCEQGKSWCGGACPWSLGSSPPQPSTSTL